MIPWIKTDERDIPIGEPTLIILKNTVHPKILCGERLNKKEFRLCCGHHFIDIKNIGYWCHLTFFNLVK